MSCHAAQSKSIYSHLAKGKRLTPVTALQKFGCFRLGARIYDLKKEGWDIRRQMVKVRRGDGSTVRVAEYFLA